MSIPNIFESMARGIGRLRGQYYKGYESVFSTSWAEPSLNDPTVWGDSRYWGDITSGAKPKTKAQFVAEFQGWVYISIRLNATSVASTPLRLYISKRQKGKKFKTIETRPINRAQKRWFSKNASLSPWLRKAAEVEEVLDHSFLQLMKEVNPWNNRRDLWETTTMFLDLTGEAYWYLPRGTLGLPKQIWVIPSQFVNPKMGKSLDEAISYYEYKHAGLAVPLSVDEVMYFNYPNPNNIFSGFSCIRGIANAVYIQNQMDAFEMSLFENRARPGGILTPKSSISKQDKKRLKEQFEQKFSGAAKAGKNLLLPKDVEFTRDTMTPAELSFIEGRKLNRTQTMAAFDIPEGAIITESSNRAVAEMADYRHAKNGILPRCRRLEEKINEKLLPRYDERLFCAFDNPVPKDEKALAERSKIYVDAGIVSRDEARADIGKVPRGGGADDLYVNMNMMPITQETPAKQIEEFTREVMAKVKATEKMLLEESA